MMLKKIAVAACFASALAVVSAPVHAAAYLIGGKWYFFSLDYDATLKKVTGKELNNVLKVQSRAVITKSQVLCGNPQGNILDPGVGPTSSVSGTTDPLSAIDVDKSDRSKSTFKKTVVVELDRVAPAETCVSPANSANGQWQPLYWQKSGCDREDQTIAGVMCYSDFAIRKADGILYFVTGPLKGTSVGNEFDWTYVYLPTEFEYNSDVLVEGVRTSGVTGTCTFDIKPGTDSPYSLNNPPVDGWAKVRTPYVCSEIPVP